MDFFSFAALQLNARRHSNAPNVRFAKPQLGSALPSLDCTGSWIPAPPPGADALLGHPLVVHFFSSNCSLCYSAAAQIARWVTDFGPHGLVVVGAYQPRPDAQATEAQARAECEKNIRAVPHPCAADAAGELALRFRNEWWPGYFVYDRQHHLRHFQAGNAGFDRLDAVVRDVALSASLRESPD